MNSKFFQFRYRNWWKIGHCGAQIAFLPHLDLYINKTLNLDGSKDWYVFCFIFAWLGFCFEFWFNESDELI